MTSDERNWRRHLLHRTNPKEGRTCSTPEELPGPTGTNEGTFTDYAPGGSLIVGPGKVHEGINRGNTPIKALVTFIVEKGKPLSTPVK